MSNTTATLPFPGAVVREHGHVTFTIYAPGMQSVHLVGDFNDWNGDEDALESHDGLWTLAKDLPDGSYRYRFFVNGDLEVTDPYATEVVREDGKAAAGVVHVGKAPYTWHHDHVNRRNFEDLIITEILPYDFSESKDFNGVLERLRYIKELGINAVQLMPVTGRAKDDEWGYQTEHFFAPHPEYGSPEDLKRLIDECHAHNIAVIQDVVLAHTSHDHTFNKLYEYEDSPWYGRGFGAENEYGLPALDQSKPATQAFVRDVLQFWLREYHVDGYRLDYVNLINEKDGMGVPKMAHDIREVRADAYIIAEMLPEIPDKLSRWDIEAAYHWHFGQALVELLKDDLTDDDPEHDLWQDFLSALVPERSGYSRARKCANYVESHDEERLVKKLRDAGADGGEARHRAALAAVLLMMAPGEPLLYQAQEWGERTPLDMEGNPIHWELLGSDGGRGLRAMYKKLIGIRNDHPAVRSENFALEYENGEQQCMVFQRWNDEGDRVVVAVNMSPQPQHVAFPMPSAGTWHEAIAEEDVKCGDYMELDLEPHAPRVWIKC